MALALDVVEHICSGLVSGAIDFALDEAAERAEGGNLMATAPKRPGPASFAIQRELIAMAKTMDLESIVTKTRRKPESILKMARRLGLSIKGRK